MAAFGFLFGFCCQTHCFFYSWRRVKTPRWTWRFQWMACLWGHQNSRYWSLVASDQSLTSHSSDLIYLILLQCFELSGFAGFSNFCISIHLNKYNKCIRSYSAIETAHRLAETQHASSVPSAKLDLADLHLTVGCMGVEGNWRVHAMHGFQWIMAICNGCGFLPTSCVFPHYIFVLQILKYWKILT